MRTDGRERLKKGVSSMWISPKTDLSAFELDEVFWFTNGRKSHENGINTYIMTMASRVPHQILAFDVDNAIQSKLIQAMVDRSPYSEKYFTDGCTVYLDVDFGGRHIRNIHNKNDTYTVEGTNADLRHYIAGLRRRSRCFFRKLETLKAVLYVFINAFNKFGHAKFEYRKKYPNRNRDLVFSHIDFI